MNCNIQTTNIIENQFARGKVNIAYLTAGDGGIARTLDAALALIAGGVNMLEIGVPFSDPIADGPIIQAAAQRALKAGVTFADILALTAAIKKQYPIPIILFSYLNPILAMIRSGHFAQLTSAGVDGLLVVDGECATNNLLQAALKTTALVPIYVIAESTTPSRIQLINKKAEGFLYYACQRGTTGVRENLPANLIKQMQMLRSQAHCPFVVGFGISTVLQVKTILQYADGVVVGSLFVDAIAKGISLTDLTHLASSLFATETHQEVSHDFIS